MTTVRELIKMLSEKPQDSQASVALMVDGCMYASTAGAAINVEMVDGRVEICMDGTVEEM